MADTQGNAVDEYISSVKTRFVTILELASQLPDAPIRIWGDAVIDRLSDADKEKLENFRIDARRLRWDISKCHETIQDRMNGCIDHVEKIEAGTETQADAMPLFVVIYGLFDETLRLSALVMRAIPISREIARLLERVSDTETNAAASQQLEERIAKLEQMIAGGFAAAAQDRTEQTREIKDKIDQKDKAAARQPKLTQEEAAKAILRAQGKRPTETAIDSTKRKIRLWEAYTQGKGGNKPPEGYPGLHVSALDFSQWAAQVQRNKAAKRALHGLVRIQKDPGADDEQTTRAELAALADTAKIEDVKKALDTFDN